MIYFLKFNNAQLKILLIRKFTNLIKCLDLLKMLKEIIGKWPSWWGCWGLSWRGIRGIDKLYTKKIIFIKLIKVWIIRKSIRRKLHNSIIIIGQNQYLPCFIIWISKLKPKLNKYLISNKIDKNQKATTKYINKKISSMKIKFPISSMN
jgi:hypothetical protein